MEQHCFFSDVGLFDDGDGRERPVQIFTVISGQSAYEEPFYAGISLVCGDFVGCVDAQIVQDWARGVFA